MAFVHRSKESSLDKQLKSNNNLGPGQYIPIKEYVSSTNLYSFNSNELRFKKPKPEEFFSPGPGSYHYEKDVNDNELNYEKKDSELKIVNSKKNRLENMLKDRNYIESKILNKN